MFVYDELGNRRETVLKDDYVASYALDSSTNQYDAAGPFEVHLGYDLAGNVISDEKGYSYEWDYENRLRRIYVDEDTDGGYDEGDDTLIAAYGYDALGRRIRMTTPDAEDAENYEFKITNYQ